MAFYLFKNSRTVTKKLLNFAHHYEFEESGLKLDDIKKIIREKRIIYDYKADQKEYKWSGKSTLKKADTIVLPPYVASNLDIFKKWLD